MSDLISRSELLESFKKSYCGHLEMENSDGMMTFRSICRIIKEQPTAYDIDKVVDELEKKSYTTTDTVCGGIFEAIRLSSAIEIVKQGGASDDVCEWKLDGVYLNSPHKPLVSCVTDENYRYYYCPVCGKKIKAVE